MREAPRRFRLFLLEFVFNLGLFALCAAVCVALLVHARSMSKESEALTQAVYLAQSTVERWRATGEVSDRTPPDENGLTGRNTVEEGTLTVSIYQGERLVYTLKGVAVP